ncbi:DNA methyltransferase [Paenarthrobacter nicotinovorans]|uniref:DNA methyltransferase n=1 Tax=Paenarthrobacter nicotinovorans TaxID=29320 RepID=UPI003D677B98
MHLVDHAGKAEPGIVLDPFMGSGTTAVVAEHLHRHWLGVELNDTFAREANKRIHEARASPAA